MVVGLASTNTSPNSLNSQKENDASLITIKIDQDYSPTSRTECSKSSTMPALSQVNNRGYYNEEIPLRYVDESASASSTMSSRNNRYISPTLTRYFYEKDDTEYNHEPTVLTNRYRANFDYNNTPPIMSYSSSPSYRYHSASTSNSLLDNGRIRGSTLYTAPHSLPRSSLNTYRNHEYSQNMHNYPQTVSCVKIEGNGLKNRLV
jgi:hypothetical protein